MSVARAVWSFWSRPYLAGGHGAWLSQRASLLSWVVSVSAARAHFPTLCLVTDAPGRRLLVDALGLPFDEVGTDLDGLAPADPAWWVAGKLAAYARQADPFVHLDYDVYLWRPLPPALLSAGVLVQNPEHFVPGAPGSYYRPHLVEEAFDRYGGRLPPEWYAVRAPAPVRWAACCGIVGGHDTGLLRRYARGALDTLGSPGNQAALRALAGAGAYHNVLFEQYLLAVYLHAHADRLTGPVRTLFADQRESFDGRAARRAGYTHLMGGAKRSPDVERRLEARARDLCPDLAGAAVALAGEALALLAEPARVPAAAPPA